MNPFTVSVACPSHQPRALSRRVKSVGDYHSVVPPLRSAPPLILENDVQCVYDSRDVASPKSVRSTDTGETKVSDAYPRIVSRMLIRRSAPQPRSRKTPRGGRKMARMILQMSLGGWSGQLDSYGVVCVGGRNIPCGERHLGGCVVLFGCGRLIVW